MLQGDYLLIGKIVGVHGLKGVLKIVSFAESLSFFIPDSELILKHAGHEQQTCIVKWSKPHKQQNVLLCLYGIDNCTQAESLIDYELFVEASCLPELEQGTYYWKDLIGLWVFTEDETFLGELVSIMPTGSNDVYVIKDRDKEILIPALESVVLNINLEDQIMQVRLPEGLL
ncbi:Ribosomal maturation factor [Desulfonema limicola]|uniref:Ribosome maturation factor RimM n=1 Tax=Desulfonema limicola TaxID=45656 RepID=A0A975B6K8_9BACT|nr:ribosome maturation factor RimM [Desulfonema limicola]QTA79756.1 Ribosomal maturation factor [Desulfonema limicola]